MFIPDSKLEKKASAALKSDRTPRHQWLDEAWEEIEEDRTLEVQDDNTSWSDVAEKVYGVS